MFRTTRFAAIATATLAMLATVAQANVSSITITVNFPNNRQPAAVTGILTLPDGSSHASTAMIMPNLTLQGAMIKRDTVLSQFAADGFDAAPGPTSTSLKVNNVPNGSSFRWIDQGTSEIQDRITVAGSTGGAVAFPGHFNPFNAQNQPAIFTAGIVTDVGTLTTQVSAQELNFQTDGPIICQALFQRLAPRAPQYGAQINYAGDRLEVYFDPAYTVTQGGIIFGSNSTSPGVTGELDLPPAQPPRVPGDMNCDGVVNNFDIDPFVSALTNRSAYEQNYPGCNWMNADVNGDGQVDFFDIDPFVALVVD